MIGRRRRRGRHPAGADLCFFGWIVHPRAPRTGAGLAALEDEELGPHLVAPLDQIDPLTPSIVDPALFVGFLDLAEESPGIY